MVLPEFLVIAARIGAEQDTVRFERLPKLSENARQLLARNMKECGVGKNAVKALGRESQIEKILMPDLAARLASGHFDKAFRAVQANGLVAQVAKGCQVTAWAAAEVEDGIWTVSRYMIE